MPVSAFNSSVAHKPLKKCGIGLVFTTWKSLSACLNDSLKANDLTSIAAKVDGRGPREYVTELAFLENRIQFKL
jgi:hypothetical protein